MSSPSSPTAKREALRLTVRLVDRIGRAEHARALAAELGCAGLLIFVADPLTGRPLPAPGFPQTLPGARAWRGLLAECTARGRATAEVTSPTTGTATSAIAARAEDGSILVLLGGEPPAESLDEVCTALPAVAAALRAEQSAAAAEAQAHLARSAAVEARALSESLDAARRELQRMYGQVREALEFRDAFLAAAAHDLRTPLTAVTGYVQMLRRHAERSGTALTERQRLALDQIEATGRRMRRLVDQLVDVARLQMGQALDLERRPTDLVALARRVAAEHQLGSERHTIRIEADVELVGYWDPIRLERVLDNIIGNAVKYSPKGGDILVALRREGEAGEWAIAAVRDQGVGIPAEDLPHVFERFHRASNVRGMVGSGIGLASVRQIVQEHGGRVEVESSEGIGSTFTVWLPLTVCSPSRTGDGEGS